MPGTLYVVATPIGNLEDVTARALRVLKEVAVIAAEDTRRTAHLLARYAITTSMTSLHEHNEARKTPAIVARLAGGEDVALVSDAGTPLISDPGRHLIQAAVAEGIRIEPIPGPSAIVTALSAAGASTGTFTFVGFPPTRSKDRRTWFDKVRGLRGTVVLFESPNRIQSTLRDIHHTLGECQVAVGRELTKIHEEFVRGPISAVSQREFTNLGEFTVVLDIGLIPENAASPVTSEQAIVAEFGVMTKINGLTRRMAISSIGRKHGLAANRVYEILEAAKKSG